MIRVLVFAVVGAILAGALGWVLAFAVVRWGWPLVYSSSAAGAALGILVALSGRKPRNDSA